MQIIFAVSGRMKGNTPTRKAFFTENPDTKDIQRIPVKYKMSVPKIRYIINAALGFIILEMCDFTAFIIGSIRRYPIIKPPVGPIMQPGPLLKPENTGRPAAPIRM